MHPQLIQLNPTITSWGHPKLTKKLITVGFKSQICFLPNSRATCDSQWKSLLPPLVVDSVKLHDVRMILGGPWIYSGDR